MSFFERDLRDHPVFQSAAIYPALTMRNPRARPLGQCSPSFTVHAYHLDACSNADSGSRGLEWGLEVLHFSKLPGDVLSAATNHPLSQTKLDSVPGEHPGTHRLCDTALCIPPPQLLIFYPRSSDNADLFFPMLLAFSSLHSLWRVLKLQDSGLGLGQGKRPIYLQPGCEVQSRPFYQRALKSHFRQSLSLIATEISFCC